MLVTIDTLPSTYQHVYLSPHFDDAALSAGGMIARQTAAGEQVLIVTICSAPPSGPLGPFAAYLHQRWGNSADPIAVRRAEDAQAAARLGADLLWLEEQDAIYRHATYDSVEAIFGPALPGDPLLARLRGHLARLQAALPAAAWYAPLAVGNHVDHQITRQAAAELAGPLAWYEDLPYSSVPGALDTALATHQPLQPTTTEIGATLERKLDAIADYASQIVELFGDEAAMRARIGGYAATIGGERVWRAIDPMADGQEHA
jgi:LmbE family N-acetylglucosaminyl deacetylase